MGVTRRDFIGVGAAGAVGLLMAKAAPPALSPGERQAAIMRLMSRIHPRDQTALAQLSAAMTRDGISHTMWGDGCITFPDGQAVDVLRVKRRWA